MRPSNATRVGSGMSRLISLSALCAVLGISGAPSMLAQAPAEPLLVVANGMSSVGFGSQPIGATGTPNAGTASLTFGTIDITGVNAADFAIASNGCSTLAPGGTCSITVQFKPSGPDARNARLRVVDNASGSPHLIPLHG